MLIKRRTFRLHHHGGNLGRIQVEISKVIVLHPYVDGATSQEEALYINVDSPGGQRQRKGESPVAVGGPKKMEHILRGGIDDANSFKGMR
jgi:hypothetical protein